MYWIKYLEGHLMCFYLFWRFCTNKSHQGKVLEEYTQICYYPGIIPIYYVSVSKISIEKSLAYILADSMCDHKMPLTPTVDSVTLHFSMSLQHQAHSLASDGRIVWRHMASLGLGVNEFDIVMLHCTTVSNAPCCCALGDVSYVIIVLPYYVFNIQLQTSSMKLSFFQSPCFIQRRWHFYILCKILFCSPRIKTLWLLLIPWPPNGRQAISKFHADLIVKLVLGTYTYKTSTFYKSHISVSTFQCVADDQEVFHFCSLLVSAGVLTMSCCTRFRAKWLISE